MDSENTTKDMSGSTGLVPTTSSVESARKEQEKITDTLALLQMAYFNTRSLINLSQKSRV